MCQFYFNFLAMQMMSDAVEERQNMVLRLALPLVWHFLDSPSSFLLWMMVALSFQFSNLFFPEPSRSSVRDESRFPLASLTLQSPLRNLPAENWKAGAVLRCLACFAGLGSGDEVGVMLFTGNKHLGARSRIPSVLSFAEHMAL
jgi:hypothetical protein